MKKPYLVGKNDFYTAVMKTAEQPSDRMMFLFVTTAWIAVVFAIAAATSWLVLLAVAIILLYVFSHVRNHMITTLGLAHEVRMGKPSSLLEIINEVQENLCTGHVEVYILKDITPKTIVTASFRKAELVLEAEAMEVMNEAEMRAIVVQQMSQIIYKNAVASAHIRPIAEKIKIPFLAPLINWSYGFWSRRITLTGDKLALLYTRDPHALIMALIKIQVGGQFAEYTEELSILAQDAELRKPGWRLAEATQDYPYTTTRVRNILELCKQYNIPLPEHVEQFTVNSK